MELREKFVYPKVDKLYVSPMKRTVETAEIIYPDMDYKIVADMRECNFGEFEGKTFAETLTEKDPNFAKWLDPKSGYKTCRRRVQCGICTKVRLSP